MDSGGAPQCPMDLRERERESSGYNKYSSGHMIFPQLLSTVKIQITLGTRARDMPNHRSSSSWKQKTTVRSDVF